MQTQLSLDEKLNFLTVDILEALDIYPVKNTTDLIENIISKHFDKMVNNQNTIKDKASKRSLSCVGR
jgi:hypothetical protein